MIGSRPFPAGVFSRWTCGFAAAVFLAACGGGGSEPPPVGSPYEDRSGWPVRELRDEPFDVLHYRVALDLDETTKSMDGQVQIELQAEEDIAEVALDAETYEVRGARAGGADLDFTHADGTLTVVLAEPLAEGETLVLEIDYGGSGIDVDATRYGMPASYDLGLDFKDETDANPQLINTLSFPEGARHWYPSVDHPADRASFELLATVREDWKVLSNGRLLGISEGARPGTRTHHWKLDEPHPTYLSVLVAGPYEVIEDFHGDIPVNYWVYPKDVEDAHRSFHKTTAMMAFFDEEFGVPYPWNKYDQITIPGIGGGAESTHRHGARAEHHPRRARRTGLPEPRTRRPRGGAPLVGRPDHLSRLGGDLADRELRDLLGVPLARLRTGPRRGRREHAPEAGVLPAPGADGPPAGGHEPVAAAERQLRRPHLPEGRGAAPAAPPRHRGCGVPGGA